MKLTKRAVEGLQPRAKTYIQWCTDPKGFGLRVTPQGALSYLVDYVNKSTGKRHRINLGRHGQLTVEQARDAAKKVFAGLQFELDPVEERNARKRSMTVAMLCDTYLEAADRNLVMGKRGKPKKASTLATDRGRIERHIKPLLGKMLVRDLSHTEIGGFVRDVTTGRTRADIKTGKLRGRAIVAGGSGTARRTTGLLSGILTFAVENGIIETNPAHGVRRQSDAVRRRALKPTEYARLGRVMRDAVDAGENPRVIQAIRLLALTGCRLGEIRNLRYDEIDVDAQCLCLSDTKEGPQNRPIGKSALAAIPSKVTEDQRYVLPGMRGAEIFGGLPKGIKRIMLRADLADVTAHTLRHSFATMASSLRLPEATVATLLGHAANSTTGKYIKFHQSLLTAADEVSDAIASLLAGGSVVPEPASMAPSSATRR